MPGKSRQSANLVSVDRVTVNPTSRNVGIGSTIPVSFFEVSGNARVTGILTVGINSSIVIDGANGRIGIGSTISITSAGLSGIAFTSLSDVNIAGLNTVTDGRALIYQNGKWIAGPVIGGYTYTTGDPYIDNVSLLLHMNGSNNSTTFVDNSKNAGINTITTNGNVAISTAQSKFGGASAVFDGTGDYLSISNNSLYNFGTGDFTVEFWIYINSYQHTYTTIIGTRPDIGTYSDGWSIDYNNSGNLYGYSDNTIAVAPGALTTGVWTHIAFTRLSGICYLFKNGVVLSSQANTQNFTRTSLSIGAAGNGASSVNGYIDDLRITKGIARYASNFTPPTAPYPDPLESNFSDVSLLLHMDGSNGSTTFTDSSSNAFTVTPYGGIAISTAQKKFASSAYFDGYTAIRGGNPHRLSIPSNSIFDLTGDFTIETWYYEITGSYSALISRRYEGATGWVLTTGGLRAVVNGSWSDSQMLWTQGAFNTWNHLALVKTGTTLTAYLNGTAVSTKTNVTSIQNLAQPLYIGIAQWFDNETAFKGYIDEFRISRFARYTSNFTPQNFPFPDTAGVAASLGYTINNLDDVDTTVAPTSGQTLLWNSTTSQWVPTTISIGSTQWVTTSAGIHTLSNVGIATTNPIQRFQVGTGSSVVVIDRDGDLGIGITNPISKFQVIGDANISGVVTAQTLNIGIGGTVIATTGIGSVGIGTALPQYRLHVVGSFGATTKSFIINHPTKEGKKLQYGSLEGPENGVYVRGRSQQNMIELPEYWSELVDETSITVNLTPVGMSVVPRVKEIANNQVEVFSIEDGDLDYYYVVFAERKDVEKLEVEI